MKKLVFLPLCLMMATLLGATCPGFTDAPECERNRDCDDDEECNDGRCRRRRDPPAPLPGPSAAQLTAYCDHLNECVVGLGGSPSESCATDAAEEVARFQADPTCASYLAASTPVITCFTAAPCETIFAGGACSEEIAVLEGLEEGCASAPGGGGGGGEGEGEGELACTQFNGIDDGCDCGCGVDSDCGGGGCAEPGCAAPACQFCYDSGGNSIPCPAP
jgi:hypothetical protein